MQKITVIKYLLQQKGGIEKRFQNYLEEFVKRGLQVSVLYASEKRSYQRVDQVFYQKVPIGLVPSRNLRKIFFAKKVDKVLQTAKYSQHLHLSMGRTGKAHVVIAAGNYPGATKKDITSSSWFHHPMYYLDKKSFDASHLIMAASCQVRNELLSLFSIEEQKVHVLYPPVKSNDFFVMNLSKRIKAAKKYKLDFQKKNFLFVSTGHKRKGLRFLLDIFASLDGSQYELYVAGDTFENNLQNVHYLGFQQKTNELYNMVDCLLHPASYEAFGQVVTESLLCGTPVLVSDRVGAKEIINEDTGRILPFEDRESWITAIQNVKKKGDYVKVAHQNDELDIAVHIDRMMTNWKNYNS
ncbi:MAG: glycosyltransferase family 4 protein [Bacteroidota bacterium]